VRGLARAKSMGQAGESVGELRFHAVPWEVDAVIRSGRTLRLVEIKTGRYSAEDRIAAGCPMPRRAFRKGVPLVLCDPGEEGAARAAGFKALP